MLIKIFIGSFILNIISEIIFIMNFMKLGACCCNPYERIHTVRNAWISFIISILLVVTNSILAYFIDLRLLTISTLPISVPVILIIGNILIECIKSKFEKRKKEIKKC